MFIAGVKEGGVYSRVDITENKGEDMEAGRERKQDVMNGKDGRLAKGTHDRKQ